MTYVVETSDVLKSAFKNYKHNSFSLIDYKDVLKNCKVTEIHQSSYAFLKSNISLYEISNDSLPSGFYYVPNPFTSSDYLFNILRDSLTNWPCDKNKMNLDIDKDRPSQIWHFSQQQMLEENLPLSSTWLYKLRWTSLGYHYHWSEQAYDLQDRSRMPDTLYSLTRALASALLNLQDYEPEAGIVNYYHINHSMCFHVDHAELAKQAPLISLSLGQSAVYLLGGLDRQVEPIPLLLQHGDVIFMTGESRQAYHSVPKIIDSTANDLQRRMLFDCATDTKDVHKCPWCHSENGLDCPNEECRTLWQYITCSRVNINVRQVIPK